MRRFLLHSEARSQILMQSGCRCCSQLLTNECSDIWFNFFIFVWMPELEHHSGERSPIHLEPILSRDSLKVQHASEVEWLMHLLTCTIVHWARYEGEKLTNLVLFIYYYTNNYVRNLLILKYSNFVVYSVRFTFTWKSKIVLARECIHAYTYIYI